MHYTACEEESDAVIWLDKAFQVARTRKSTSLADRPDCEVLAIASSLAVMLCCMLSSKAAELLSALLRLIQADAHTSATDPWIPYDTKLYLSV